MKTKFSLLILILVFAFGFQQNKTSDHPATKKGMIKITVMYPSGEGKTFDMDYYKTKHMPLVQSLWGDAMKGFSIDKGIAAGAPDAPVPYLAIGYLYFESIAAYQEKRTAAVLEKVRADFPKYTNVVPVIQISEVIQ